MTEQPTPRPFPRFALIGAGVLIAATITAAIVVRYYIGADTFPPAAAALASRDLRFEDHADGSITVRNARDGAVLDEIAPGTNGFLRATLRGLAYERKHGDVGPTAPFRLTAYADGRLTLEDTGTGRRIDLQAFGQTNLQAFTHLLPLPAAKP